MKKNQPKQKLLLITAIILLLTSFENIIMATGSYDTTRFYNVMAKARRGEPITIEGNVLLNDASALFKKTNVDTILVTENGKPVGMLDIQDLKTN